MAAWQQHSFEFVFALFFSLSRLSPSLEGKAFSHVDFRESPVSSASKYSFSNFPLSQALCVRLCPSRVHTHTHKHTETSSKCNLLLAYNRTTPSLVGFGRGPAKALKSAQSWDGRAPFRLILGLLAGLTLFFGEVALLVSR